MNYEKQFEDLKSPVFGTKIKAVKDLERVAQEHPEIIVQHYDTLIQLLEDGNYKVKWGTTQLIYQSAHIAPAKVFKHLGLLGTIADGNSVIARDNYVKILALLSEHKKYRATTVPLLLDEVLKSPVNQLPSYALHASKAVRTTEEKDLLKEYITLRLPDTDAYPPKTQKLRKLLQVLSKN